MYLEGIYAGFYQCTVVDGAVAQKSYRSKRGSFFIKIECQGTSMKTQGTGVDEIPFGRISEILSVIILYIE